MQNSITQQAGWADDTADFLRELKSLQAFDMSNLGMALKKSFELLNSNRINLPTETYGLVRRCESGKKLQPILSAIVALTLYFFSI